MTPTSALPLFRLPTLLLEDVLDNMPVLEQYILSKTSKKAQLVVKIFLASHHAQFHLGIDCYDKFRLSLNESVVVSRMEHPSDAQVIRFIEYFTYVFNISQVSLAVFEKSHFFVNNIIKTIKKLKLRIEKVNVYSDGLDYSLLEMVLNECRHVSDLYIDCEAFSDFTYDHRMSEPFQCDSLRIIHAEWVDHRHLVNLFIDCKEIVIDECILTNRGLARFIRRWIQGCNLKRIQLTHNGIEFSTIFAHLPATPVRRAKIDGEIKEFPYGKCYRVVQCSGVVALVFHLVPNFFLLTTGFEVRVGVDDYEDEDEEDE